MTDDERRRIVEDIARNADNYPRDGIAAVRALREIAFLISVEPSG